MQSFTRKIVITAALFVAMGVSLIPGSASAEKGIVSVVSADVRAEPKEKAKAKLKIKQGRHVTVVDHTPDGQWLKVKAEFDRGGDTGELEGWIQKKYVRSLTRYGFSWERKDGAGGTAVVDAGGGGDTLAAPGGDEWGTGAADSGSGDTGATAAAGMDDWGTGDSGGDAGGDFGAAAAAPADDWGATDTGASSDTPVADAPPADDWGAAPADDGAAPADDAPPADDWGGDAGATEPAPDDGGGASDDGW